MICGIGVDVVEIRRFVHWHQFSQKQLTKIFTPSELAYSFENSLKTAERLAVRFAAKEAFYKAITGLIKPISFYKCSKYIGIERARDQKPFFNIAWERFLTDSDDLMLSKSLQLHLSLSHTKEVAIAYVLLENSVPKLLS